MPRAKRTQEELVKVQGLLEMRKHMTKVFNAARNNKEVTITEFGFDRDTVAVYKLVKVIQ
jgi:hypothetical protein